ncbi:MAG: AAA family ATPase, partial [Caldilineaceae bacterium]|nr:AAA family ATPase [Caldilineaceae bacterium]
MSQARTLHIRLFGEFSLTYGDEPVTGVKSDRPQSLLAFLLLYRSAPQSRQRIAFTLWPDTSEANARGSLRNLLFLLRQGLPDVDTFIVGDSSSLQWSNDAPYTLDVADFEHALAQVRSATDQAEQRYWLERAVDQYSGDLLPGNYDDWVIPIREELRQNYLDALYRLSGLLEEEGDYRAAIRYLQRQLQVDPLDEAAYVRLMRAHALSGDRAGIRRVYQTCVNALRRELDVDPSPSTQAAYEQLLRFEPPAAALPEAPARAAMPALPEPLAPHIDERLWRPRPLPVPAAPFIGREAEMAQIAERLSDPDCRLLTLVGPGGVGKTRLALQVAAGHRAVFQDGVAYASLAALANADELAPAIADALGVALTSGADMHELLFRLLRSKQLLLVLDNFEHLVEEVDLLVNLLRTAPQVKLLVTSRQRLDLLEEWVYELQGFAVPESGATPKDSAVDLFLQSARRVRQNFEPDGEDIQSIVSICQMVGGLPLGIELAASWMRMLSPADIVREMERTLDFLTLNRRNLPERHRSLRAVFDHSWRLLSTTEQQLLSRLAVFRGDFSREAAEQVAGATLPMLLSLVDKSLVRLREGGRYGLHQLVHQFAREKLMEQSYGGAGRPEDGMEATHRRYAEHFLSLAEAALAAMRGTDPVGSLDQLRAEHDNLRGALSWT